MPDDFTRLMDAVWRASAEHCNKFGGHAVSDRHGRAIVIAVLWELHAMADEEDEDAAFVRFLIAQAKGGQK